jgi:hypothetical protein
VPGLSPRLSQAGLHPYFYIIIRTLVWTTWPSLSCARPVPPTIWSWPSPASAFSPPPDQRSTSLLGKAVATYVHQTKSTCLIKCTVSRDGFCFWWHVW